MAFRALPTPGSTRNENSVRRKIAKACRKRKRAGNDISRLYGMGKVDNRRLGINTEYRALHAARKVVNNAEIREKCDRAHAYVCPCRLSGGFPTPLRRKKII